MALLIDFFFFFFSPADITLDLLASLWHKHQRSYAYFCLGAYFCLEVIVNRDVARNFFQGGLNPTPYGTS